MRYGGSGCLRLVFLSTESRWALRAVGRQALGIGNPECGALIFSFLLFFSFLFHPPSQPPTQPPSQPASQSVPESKPTEFSKLHSSY